MGRGRLGRWIIPARAGFTIDTPARDAYRRDHPRSRGVYFTDRRCVWAGIGSSPLARGLLPDPVPGTVHIGIIPARAGFTHVHRHPQVAHPDHPRSRGVYGPWTRPQSTCSGSSPLARGLPTFVDGGDIWDGIIPARAGFTGSGIRRLWRRRWIIPARAGFTYFPVTDVRWTSGSSPLARGLQFGGAQRRGGQGIIPARAGFTDGSACIEAFQRDHPRSRGVYVRAWRMCSSVTGSSPLARGLHRRQWVSIMGARIIPARAGFTPPDRRRRGRLGDHPRSRGVYGLFIGLYVSPRRIIPARAGFT